MSTLTRTLVLVEILGDGPWTGDLDTLSEDVTNGDRSGAILMLEQRDIEPAHMAQLLIAQGSDPEFLGICCSCQAATTDDGEGWNGRCGNCADKAEGVREERLALAELALVWERATTGPDRDEGLIAETVKRLLDEAGRLP